MRRSSAAAERHTDHRVRLETTPQPGTPPARRVDFVDDSGHGVPHPGAARGEGPASPCCRPGLSRAPCWRGSCSARERAVPLERWSTDSGARSPRQRPAASGARPPAAEDARPPSRHDGGRVPRFASSPVSSTSTASRELVAEARSRGAGRGAPRLATRRSRSGAARRSPTLPASRSHARSPTSKSSGWRPSRSGSRRISDSGARRARGGARVAGRRAPAPRAPARAAHARALPFRSPGRCARGVRARSAYARRRARGQSPGRELQDAPARDPAPRPGARSCPSPIVAADRPCSWPPPPRRDDRSPCSSADRSPTPEDLRRPRSATGAFSGEPERRRGCCHPARARDACGTEASRLLAVFGVPARARGRRRCRLRARPVARGVAASPRRHSRPARSSRCTRTESPARVGPAGRGGGQPPRPADPGPGASPDSARGGLCDTP